MQLACVVLACCAVASAAESGADLVRAGHFKRARSWADLCLKANAKDAEAHAVMARVKEAFANMEAAVANAEQAVAIEPKSAEFHYVLGQLYGRSAERVSLLRGIALGRKCVLATFYAKAPAMVGGDRKRAADVVAAITKRHPDKAFFIRAHMADKTGERETLEGYYRSGLEANPVDIGARIAYGNLLLKKTPPPLDIVERNARELLKLDPGCAAAYGQLALRFLAEEKWAEMDGILLQGEKNLGDNLAPHYSAASALLNRGKELSRTETLVRRYPGQEPEGKMPDHARAHWTLGLILEKLGRKNEAIAALQKSVALRPEFEPACKDLKRLKA